MISKKEGQKGFTLIELLVVVAIIGLLASVVIASLSSARSKGRDARRVADLKQIQVANEMFFDAYSTYASSTGVATFAPTYISKVPTDPRSGNAYAYAGLLGSATAPSCGGYHMGAKLETTGSTLINSRSANAGGNTVCTNGSWGGGDIAAASGDFDGSAALVFDIKN